MKDDSTPSSKALQQRFQEIGSKLMAVPKAQVEAEEKKWQRQRARQNKGRAKRRA